MLSVKISQVMSGFEAQDLQTQSMYEGNLPIKQTTRQIELLGGADFGSGIILTRQSHVSLAMFVFQLKSPDAELDLL